MKRDLIIAVPREIKRHDYRVAPADVAAYIRADLDHRPDQPDPQLRPEIANLG